MGAHYRAGSAMLLGSGAVTHADLVDYGNRLFAGLPAGLNNAPQPAQFRGGDKRGHDDLEQAHLAFAFPGVPASHTDAILAQVFATALGGGMSSRLFQEAREKRGLCYAIYAFAQSYRDSGAIGIYAGTAEDKAAEIAPIIAGEIAGLAAGATEEEAARARAQLKASLLIGLESPQARCEYMASHIATFGRVLSVAELTARIDAVDAAALRRLAGRVCEFGGPAIAAVGPVKRLESRERFAARFGAALAGAA
jgi:predicted Zn-dependent peptidase